MMFFFVLLSYLCCKIEQILVWYANLNLYNSVFITYLQVEHWDVPPLRFFIFIFSTQTAVVWESADVASCPRGSDAGDPRGCRSGRQWRWGGRPWQTHLQWVPALFPCCRLFHHWLSYTELNFVTCHCGPVSCALILINRSLDLSVSQGQSMKCRFSFLQFVPMTSE